MPTIYTHVSPDVDAVASVWAVLRFILKLALRDVTIILKSANWDGADMVPGAIAVDMLAGGRGIKGRNNGDGVLHSCFARLIEEHAPLADQEALGPVVSVIDAQDTYGSAIRFFAPGVGVESERVLGLTGLGATWRAIQAFHRDDVIAMERMFELLDGFLMNGRNRMKAEREADTAELLFGGQIAIMRNARHAGTQSALFERGVQVIIYIDQFNLGVTRCHDVVLRMDAPVIRAVVLAAGEEIGDGEGKWFAHPTGFIFARGTRKAPAVTPSRIDPYALAAAVAQLLGVVSERSAEAAVA